MMGKDKNKDKQHQDGETAASAKNITSPRDTHQSNGDLSQDREARDTTKAVAREIAKAHAQYQALLNDKSMAIIPTSLKVTSGTNGFKVMDPFDWTQDKTIYQRWQLWSPLMLWRVTQKRLRFHTFTIGSMEREWDILSYGKTTKPSFASLSMMD